MYRSRRWAEGRNAREGADSWFTLLHSSSSTLLQLHRPRTRHILGPFPRPAYSTTAPCTPFRPWPRVNSLIASTHLHPALTARIQLQQQHSYSSTKVHEHTLLRLPLLRVSLPLENLSELGTFVPSRRHFDSFDYNSGYTHTPECLVDAVNPSPPTPIHELRPPRSLSRAIPHQSCSHSTHPRWHWGQWRRRRRRRDYQWHVPES